MVQQSARGGDPASVHLILWKYRGIPDQAPAYGRTSNEEVWNQPGTVAKAAVEAVNNMLTNVQESKHDAAMAAIQNTR